MLDIKSTSTKDQRYNFHTGVKKNHTKIKPTVKKKRKKSTKQHKAVNKLQRSKMDKENNKTNQQNETKCVRKIIAQKKTINRKLHNITVQKSEI